MCPVLQQVTIVIVSQEVMEKIDFVLFLANMVRTII